MFRIELKELSLPFMMEILTAAKALAAAIFVLALTSLATATFAMICGALAIANLALTKPSLGAASDSWM